MSERRDEIESSAHVGDLAELYALGALTPDERIGVDAHVAGCAACAYALGRAEATVTALDAAFVPELEVPARLGARIAASAQTVVPFAPRPMRPTLRRVLPQYAATAAALVLAAGLGSTALVERAADERQAATDSTVLTTLANAHFLHVSFSSLSVGVPASKVLYARDGTWLYVIVASATYDCRIVAHTATGPRSLGQPAARGQTATLFVRDGSRPTQLDLVDGSGRVVARAPLRYPTP